MEYGGRGRSSTYIARNDIVAPVSRPISCPLNALNVSSFLVHSPDVAQTVVAMCGAIILSMGANSGKSLISLPGWRQKSCSELRLLIIRMWIMSTSQCASDVRINCKPAKRPSSPCRPQVSKKVRNLRVQSSVLRKVMGAGATVMFLSSSGTLQAAELGPSQVFSASCAGAACNLKIPSAFFTKL